MRGEDKNRNLLVLSNLELTTSRLSFSSLSNSFSSVCVDLCLFVVVCEWKYPGSEHDFEREREVCEHFFSLRYFPFCFFPSLLAILFILIVFALLASACSSLSFPLLFLSPPPPLRPTTVFLFFLPSLSLSHLDASTRPFLDSMDLQN